MVRLANEEPLLHEAGAEVVAVSVDSPERNEAFRRRWRLPFPVVSDPAGEQLLRPLDAWNPHERGGIGWPTIMLFDPEGREVFRARSRDFADRAEDDDVLAAARSLGVAEIALDAAPPEAEPEQHEAALRVEAFGPYFRGISFATKALARRLTHESDRDETLAMSAMADSFLVAWRERRDTTTSGG